MKILDILNFFKTKEQKILIQPMYEMANLYQKQTGIVYPIWFGQVGGQHGPRIKVSNIPGRFVDNDNFVVSVSKTPTILTPKSCKLKQDELHNIFDWVILNYNDLMILWTMHENQGYYPDDIELDMYTVLARLKKI